VDTASAVVKSPLVAKIKSGVKTAPGMTIQYGIPLLSTYDGVSMENLNTNNIPWISPGSNWVQSVDGDENYIYDDLYGEILFTFTIGGATLCVDSVIDPDTGNVTNTNWEDWPNTVVILRSSTNLCDWIPVHTNSAVGVNTVETWTDPDPPAGSSCFYRAEYPLQTNAPAVSEW
jgi:hypothetical protein